MAYGRRRDGIITFIGVCIVRRDDAEANEQIGAACRSVLGCVPTARTKSIVPRAPLKLGPRRACVPCAQPGESCGDVTLSTPNLGICAIFVRPDLLRPEGLIDSRQRPGERRFLAVQAKNQTGGPRPIWRASPSIHEGRGARNTPRHNTSDAKLDHSERLAD
jgi:hypothetical protein